MKIETVSFPVKIAKLKEHDEIKSNVLDAINRQTDYEKLVSEGNNIERCDFTTSRFDFQREWVKHLVPSLKNHLLSWCEDNLYTGFSIIEMWFQQYVNSSEHGWHVHGNNFTSVYYLELPKDTPQTQYISPMDRKTVCNFDVEEGDIITFPSVLIHRAPMNKSNERKTIISWNMDIGFNDGYEA